MSDTPNSIWISGIRAGIGRAIAQAAARQGAAVAGFSRGLPSDDALATQLCQAGATHAYTGRADITEPETLQAWADAAISACGTPNIYIHNAAILGPRAELADIPAAQWQETLRVNSTGAFMFLQCSLLAADPGRPTLWVWLSSSVATHGRAGWGPYAASKAALENMHETWADEIAERPWTSIAVNPGGTRTAMRAQAYPNENPETLPTPDDVANRLFELIGQWQNGADINGNRFNLREI